MAAGEYSLVGSYIDRTPTRGVALAVVVLGGSLAIASLAVMGSNFGCACYDSDVCGACIRKFNTGLLMFASALPAISFGLVFALNDDKAEVRLAPSGQPRVRERVSSGPRWQIASTRTERQLPGLVLSGTF